MKNVAFYLFGFLSLSLSSAFSFAINPPLSQIDAYKIIQVSGEDSPPAVGMKISDLSVAAIIDDVLEPIPFQIDEYNVGGAIYFEQWDVPISGTKDVFDEADKILFMFKDAGPRLNDKHVIDGELVSEIKLLGKDGVSRYAYLLKGAKLRSDEQYVRYSSELALVETDFYSLTYDKENHLKWLDFTARDFQGEPPLDSMKIRLETGLLTSITPTTLTNDEFVAVPTGELTGPIRSTTQLKVTAWIMNVPILDISLQLHHYPKSIIYDTRVLLPKVRRKLIVNPVLSLSTEGNKLLGATVHSALGPSVGGMVDGIVDDNEQQMIESGIDQKRNWLYVATQRILDLVAFFNYLGDTNEPIALKYMDSLDNVDSPERYPGQLPNVGYKILNLPSDGFFGFSVGMYFSKGFKGNPSEFTYDLRTPPEMQISSPI